MTAVQELDLTVALLQVVKKHCAQPDGTLVFTSVQADLALAEDVAATFEAAGVQMPSHVDQILAGAVAFASMIGAK